MVADVRKRESVPTGDSQSIVRRRALPNGRAVVGALLVTIAAVGSFAMATGDDAQPRTSYLVAARSIDVGERLAASDVTAMAIDLPPGVVATVADSPSDVEGATALRDLRPGELVASHDLLEPSTTPTGPIAGVHELTLPVPRVRAGRTLVAGDRVTILARSEVEQVPVTVVAVEDALVVEWANGEDGIGTSTTAVLTVALDDPTSVMELVHLAGQGEVTVVRTTRALADTYPRSFPDLTADTPLPPERPGADLEP